MTNQNLAALQAQVCRKALEIGIDKIGFASAEPFDHLEESLMQQKARHYTSGFEHPNLKERIYLDLIFDQPQSIISICLAYPSQLPNPLPSDPGNRRGSFARASWGLDYHEILRQRMKALMDYLQDLFPDNHFKAMVDTGELIDVAVAERAGIGFIGKNGLIITPEFGSFVYLGEIITDIPFTPSQRIPNGCGDCDRCIRSCPTQALLGDGRMNAQRCLSYQTQTKGHLPEKFRRKITHVIYGCDICQLTCPYNKGHDHHRHPEMEPQPDQVQPALKPMLTLNNKEFKRQFGSLAGSWRGKKPLQRNAIVSLANYGDQTALPLLLELIERDPRPVIRATAAYAVSRIQKFQNEQMVDLIKGQLDRESDPETVTEMQKAIETLEIKRKQPVNR